MCWMCNLHMDTHSTHIPPLQALQGLLIDNLVNNATPRSRLRAAQALRSAAAGVAGRLSEEDDEVLAAWLAVVLRRLEG